MNSKLCSFTLCAIAFLFSLSAEALIGGRMLRARDPQGPSRSVVLIEIKSHGVPFGLCTGTVISKNAVLTAAHCFDPALAIHYTGFEVVFDSYKDSGSVRSSAAGTRVAIHPGYTPVNRKKNKILKNDIAIAFFDAKLPPGIEPAPIDTDIHADYSRVQIQVFGYGRSVDYTGQPGEDPRFSTGVLRYASLVVAHESHYNSKDHYGVFPHPESPAYLCQGDSGGPQFVYTTKGFKLIGVNSGGGVPKPDGSGMLTCISWGVGAKVAPVSKWILKQIQGY